MSIVIHFLGVFVLMAFWAAVLSFVPITFYLLAKNPPIQKIDRTRSKMIFILNQESYLKKARKLRIKTILLTYTLSLTILFGVHSFNLRSHGTGIGPFDILSALSIVFFGFSIFSYVPISVYLALRNPWKDKDEGVCLTKIYISYGVAILCFSIAFALFWLKKHSISFGLFQIVAPLGYMLLSSVFVAYLPILLYISLRIGNISRQKKIHPNIIFIIYSLSFLLSSAVYVASWIKSRGAGLENLF